VSLRCSPSHYFFLYCFRARRSLHSFPTRHSSDLVEKAGLRRRRRAGFPGNPPRRYTAGQGRIPKGGRSSGANHHQFPVSSSVGRSEEHTSELQSPDHLVCRLLLEKKKKNKKQHE